MYTAQHKVNSPENLENGVLCVPSCKILIILIALTVFNNYKHFHSFYKFLDTLPFLNHFKHIGHGKLLDPKNGLPDKETA